MQFTLGLNTMIHHHYKREFKQLGMILPAEIHSVTLLNTNSPWNHCQLLTAQERHGAACSKMFPTANTKEPAQLWWALYRNRPPHQCQNLWKHIMPLWQIVDELGLHGFCTENAGHFPRHSAIKSILKRSLTRINLPSILEACWPDKGQKEARWLTLGPWYRGLSLLMGCNSCGHFC